MKATLNLSEIKVGDFINASYKYGCVSGIIIKIFKNHVVVSQHQQYYNYYKDLKISLNVTKKRISEVNNPINTYS